MVKGNSIEIKLKLLILALYICKVLGHNLFPSTMSCMLCCFQFWQNGLSLVSGSKFLYLSLTVCKEWQEYDDTGSPESKLDKCLFYRSLEISKKTLLHHAVQASPFWAYNNSFTRFHSKFEVRFLQTSMYSIMQSIFWQIGKFLLSLRFKFWSSKSLLQICWTLLLWKLLCFAPKKHLQWLDPTWHICCLYLHWNYVFKLLIYMDRHPKLLHPLVGPANPDDMFQWQATIMG